MISPSEFFWFALVLKVAMTATVIVAASIVVERGGPFIGALVASLPTSVGAAYIILAMEHEPAFVSMSAIGTLAANVGGAIVIFVYALLAQRRSLVVSLGAAIAAWLLCAALIRMVEWTAWTAVLLNAAVFLVTIPLTRAYRAAAIGRLRTEPRRFDIPVRAAVVALFVVTVTTLSHSIGPFASGMFAIFPIAMSSFIVILHTRIGGPATANVMAHAQVPLIGLVFGFLAVHFGATTLGVWWALTLGLLACILWNATLWLERNWRLRRATTSVRAS